MNNEPSWEKKFTFKLTRRKNIRKEKKYHWVRKRKTSFAAKGKRNTSKRTTYLRRIGKKKAFFTRISIKEKLLLQDVTNDNTKASKRN